MAAYPSHAILLESTQELEPMWQDAVSSAGTLHSRQFHAAQQYRFTLVHRLTGTQYETLLATFHAGPRDTYTLTYRTESPAISYSVKFIGPPQIVENFGNGSYKVRVPLRGTKN